jgi:imidazolonepropionase-like amidohydrolase
LNPVNSIYFDDRAFEEAVDFGVLYSCVIPGSGNVLGGKAMIIKNYAKNRSNAVLKDYGYKMALGYNPRSTTDWHGTRPNTRMGVYALLEEKFDSILQKKAKLEIEYQQDLTDVDKEKPDAEQQKSLIQKKYDSMFEWSSEEKALLELLEGKKTAKVHVHKEDDALYLAELVKKYHIKATADHTSDFTHTEVYDILAEAGIKVCYGPCGSFDYKVELKHSHYGNVKYLMKSKVQYGLISDHPVTLSANLKDSLKYFLYEGMNQTDAINLITRKNAEILEIDDILGTIEKGKLASLIVWNKDPFNLASFPRVVMGEGKILRK